MSGFCVAKTEGHPHLCPSDTYTCGKYCKDYEQGKIAPIYPVPAIAINAVYGMLGVYLTSPKKDWPHHSLLREWPYG